MLKRNNASLCALLVFCAAACSPKKAPTTESAQPASDDAATSASNAKRYEHCARLDREAYQAATKALRPLSIASVPLIAEGYKLVPQRKIAAPAQYRIGALGSTRQALPRTLRALGNFAQQFVAAGVDAVVLLGSIDTTFEGIKQVLTRLRLHLPPRVALLALPGTLASRSGFSAAAADPKLGTVDLTAARLIALPNLTIASLPGYHLPLHLAAAEQGCGYGAEDLEALNLALQPQTHPRLLLAHGPPQGKGPQAIDRSFGATNIGDPQLTATMKQSFAFGLFAHVSEAGGRATTAAGQAVAPRQWTSSLWLNVGSAENIPYEDLDGGWHQAMAAIIEIRDRRARYWMLEQSK